MIEITVVYSDKSQIDRIGDTGKYSPIFHFVDTFTYKSKKEAWRVKSHYGAKLDPFAVVVEDNKPIKAFYSEAEDVIGSLIKYLNDMNNNVIVNVINNSENKLPQYETKGSAGFDIRVDFSRVTPENTIKVYGDAEVVFAGEGHTKTMIRLEPMTRALLPTGLFTAIPEGWQVSFRPRSGMAIKKGLTLINTPSLIDCDYRGEWKLPVINLGQETVWIEDGERICQGVLEQVNHIEWNEVNTLDETERGKGGFNSTGSK